MFKTSLAEVSKFHRQECTHAHILGLQFHFQLGKPVLTNYISTMKGPCHPSLGHQLWKR